MIHQGMAGVEHLLDSLLAVAFLALGDVVPGKHQIIEDALGVGPGTEQVVALEERVVTVTGMRYHQCLHGHGVFFHEISDAGTRVDDDLVGQAHLTAPVTLLRGHELFAERPVMVAHRHAHRGIRVDHLLGGDHLDLGSDPFCGGDAASSSCQVSGPGGGITVMFNSYDKSGANARTDTYDITSGFPGTFNGNWTFTLEDEDAMGCNTVTETRIIVTYTDSATGSPSFCMFVD